MAHMIGIGRLEQEIAEVQALGYTPLTDDELECMYRTLKARTWWRETTPLAHCWECDGLVPDAQSQRSMPLFQAVICTWCEPWVRAADPEQEEEADAFARCLLALVRVMAP